METEWRKMHGFNQFEISNDGRIRKILDQNLKILEKPITIKNKIKKESGNIIANIAFGPYNKRKIVYVARILLLSFVGPPEEYPRYYAKFKDGNQHHIHISNLEWSPIRHGCHSDQKYPTQGRKPYAIKKEEAREINDKSNSENRKFRKRFFDGQCPNKYIIEQKLTTIASLYFRNQNALTICGPNYHRHMANLFLELRCLNVTICEINHKTCDYIWAQARGCPYYMAEKVNIINSDIEEINHHHISFQDLDLMGTWKKCYKIFEHRLIKQSQLSSSTFKGMIFTVSERSGGGKEVSYQKINQLLSVLNCEITGFDGIACGFGHDINLSVKAGKMNYIYNHIPNFREKGRVEQLILFSYSDGAPPMMTGMIIYQ